MAEEKTVYAQINRKVWTTCQFRGLSREARELFFYLTTCPHGNMLGIFVLRPGYALDDLQWTDRKQFTEALGELLNKGLFKYDSKTEIILDMEQIVKHPPVNGNMITAAIKIINSLPKTPLFQDLKLLVESLGKPYVEPLAKRLGERYGNPVTVTVTVTETVKQADAPVDKHLPTKDEIEDFADPKVKQEIENISVKLYEEKIFPEVNAFKNKMLKAKKNPRSILHTLCRAYIKKTFDKGPWAYCQEIIEKENLNYNERDYIKAV